MIVASRLYGWGRLVLFLMVVFTACHSNNGPQDEKLYEGFRDPPPEARPFVRWWWNGNRIEADELTREIELLRECGFGGVEINPIALPPEARETGVEPREWMSDKWIELLVHACQVVHDKEMIVDLIVGSGWPFGGEFLNSDEINQRVVTREIIIEDQSRLSFTSENFMGGLLDATRPGQDNDDIGEEYPPRVLYVSLMPGMLNEMEQVIDLTRDLKSDGLIDIPLQEERKYLLNYGVIQKGHREVMHGAPGASGPVMDHYKKDVTMAYLSRLKQISVQTGIPLSELIRALFCDSIELAGSNWTDGFAGLFLEKYGYELQPFLPFVFQAESDLRTELDLPEQVIDQTRRARFDYNRLLVDTFLENFTAAFQEFCDASDLRCRYQAYGTPFLMGMLEGYMIPDIPESNNWIYSAPMDSPSWQWNQDHGYMIWNLYAAAGGHLTGKRIISCEAMTNTRGVFKTSLEEIKQHDDMNFITGINHSVLHGFNYSPPEAGFPGWIRYGAYFSEQNPWWPCLHRWVEYNARLSFIFQHSRPRKSIAIMGPTGDLWSETGLVRQPFHTRPWYLHRLWQPISQAGYSCEYLNQRAMQDAEIVDGRIRYGPMSYRTLVLADVKSVHPGVARKIRQFVEEGGELVLIDRVPERSLHMTDSRKNDEMVREVFSALVGQYPHSVFRLSSPADRSMLNAWVYGWLEKLDLQPDVVIRVPDEDVYQIYQATETKDIYFFTNVHRKDTAMIHAIFPTGGRIPYLWDPESGERWRYPFQSDAAELDLVLPPLRSLLLVFEPDEKDLPVYPEFAPALKGTYMARVDRPDRRWTVKGEHVNGTTCRWEMTELKDLSTSPDSMKNSFAGRLIFSTQFENTENISHIHLGETHRGVTEVYVNGALAGVNWYGEPLFPVGPLLRPGNNDLEIRYTTVLANYCLELDDPVARRWTVYEEKVPCGLEGPVWLMRYENP